MRCTPADTNADTSEYEKTKKDTWKAYNDHAANSSASTGATTNDSTAWQITTTKTAFGDPGFYVGGRLLLYENVKNTKCFWGVATGGANNNIYI